MVLRLGKKQGNEVRKTKAWTNTHIGNSKRIRKGKAAMLSQYNLSHILNLDVVDTWFSFLFGWFCFVFPPYNLPLSGIRISFFGEPLLPHSVVFCGLHCIVHRVCLAGVGMPRDLQVPQAWEISKHPSLKLFT